MKHILSIATGGLMICGYTMATLSGLGRTMRLDAIINTKKYNLFKNRIFCRKQHFLSCL